MGDSVGLYMHGAAWGVPVADKEHRRRVDDTRRDDDAFSPYSSSVSNPSNEASNRFDLINGKFSSRAFLNDERLFYGTDLSPESPSERGGSLSNIVNSVLSSPNKGSAKATGGGGFYFPDQEYVPNVQERAAENDFGYVSRYSSIFSGEESEPALMETRQSTQELERIVQQNYGDLKLTDVKKVAEPNGMSGQDAASHAMYPDEHPQAWPRGSQKTKKDVTASEKKALNRSTSSPRSGGTSNYKHGSNKSDEGGRPEFQYPLRPGFADCQYYLKTGKCTYGARCKFNHPVRDERLVTALNRRDCFDFVQTGKCPYGRSCKYNHPNRKDMAVLGLGNGALDAAPTRGRISTTSTGTVLPRSPTRAPAKGAAGPEELGPNPPPMPLSPGNRIDAVARNPKTSSVGFANGTRRTSTVYHGHQSPPGKQSFPLVLFNRRAILACGLT
uniref:C3H1-type domain-containing protein n=1 Tax=Rhodosorus marinus TaxID=101924 RepID=A0A7S3EHM0_9RHOD|mmetsp:Transcript_33194/g.130668  ORF Transcript_33194/g.130668 Transcript_33194/m.130668 type:complete len:443 (+) Transcript_33194:584-1912(+)